MREQLELMIRPLQAVQNALITGRHQEPAVRSEPAEPIDLAERIDVFGAPKVVQHDEQALTLGDLAELAAAMLPISKAVWLVPERIGQLGLLLGGLRLASEGEPHDAVRESPLHLFVVDQRGRQHRLADTGHAMHADSRCVSQKLALDCLQRLGPFLVVRR